MTSTASEGDILTRPGALRAVGSLLMRGQREIELRVVGDSMNPTLPEGSRIRVRARDSGAYRHGEVVAFVAGDRIVTHRVVTAGRFGPARGHLLTQGDNRYLPEPVPLGNVLGSVDASAGDSRLFTPVPSAHRGARARRRLSRSLAGSLGALLQISPRLAVFACDRVHRWVVVRTTRFHTTS